MRFGALELDLNHLANAHTHSTLTYMLHTYAVLYSRYSPVMVLEYLREHEPRYPSCVAPGDRESATPGTGV